MGVPVLQDGFLECVDVNVPVMPGVASDGPFNGIDTYISPAVALREGHGAKAVVYSPFVKELSAVVDYEFRTTVS